MLGLLCFCLLGTAFSTDAVEMDQSAEDTSSCRRACINGASLGVSAACMRSDGMDAGCYRQGMLALGGRCTAKCTASPSKDSLSFKSQSGLSKSRNKAGQGSTPNNLGESFVECLGDCLGESVHYLEMIELICEENVFCWVGAVGGMALICVPKCALNPEMQTPLGNDLLDCAGTCSIQPTAKLASITQKCQKDVDCWLQEDGLTALKCVPTCIQTKVDSIPQLKSDIMPCLGKCLKKSLTEVTQVYGECHENVECWVKKEGAIASGCLPKCIGSKGMTR